MTLFEIMRKSCDDGNIESGNNGITDERNSEEFERNCNIIKQKMIGNYR